MDDEDSLLAPRYDSGGAFDLTGIDTQVSLIPFICCEL